MRKSKDETNHINIKHILLCVVFLFFAVIIIINSFSSPSEEEFGYQINKKANYKVKVKENNFFEDEYIETNQAYISSLIDKILIDFNYKFIGTQEKEIEYSYDIITIMKVNYSEGNENLWSKEDIVVENKSMKLENNTEFNIQENIEINYNLYNNMAKQFKANFNIPIDSTLEIKLTVKQKIDGQEIAPPSTISLNMKLNEDIFKISQKTTGIDTYKQANDEDTVNEVWLIIGIVIFVGLISILLKAVMNKTGFGSSRSEYAKAISKILKNYGDVVAEIIRPVEITDDMQIIDVKNFDQLLDVEEELRMPILFYEVEKGKEGCFIIINNNIAYRYILKNKKRR